jgi:chorismate mutase
VHGRIRRYTSPDEYAFFPEDLPPLVLPPIAYVPVLAPCSTGVNINAAILDMYLAHLLPEIAAAGDDHNYGSTAMNDVTALQVGARGWAGRGGDRVPGWHSPATSAFRLWPLHGAV